MKNSKQIFIYAVLIVLAFSHNDYAQCWQNISAGNYHNLALKPNGTLWAWGYNKFGQVGTDTINKLLPIQIGTDTDWLSISTGLTFSTALKNDGTLWVWGNNVDGELGDGTFVNKNLPTQLGTDNDWKFISAGYANTLAIKTNGTLWAWGFNGNGELGDGTLVSKNLPTQIGTDSDWESVSTNKTHTVAIKTDGTLWAWGFNGNGELGDGTLVNKTVPTKIGTDTDWSLICSGDNHTIALKTNGTLWAWGYNGFAALGDDTFVNKNVPTQIGTDTNWKSISAGFRHSIALKTDGTIWTWGTTTYGQIGLGQINNFGTTVPTQVGTDNTWQEISAGSEHNISLKTDGTLWAWGYNREGELGNGLTLNKSRPTQSGNITPTFSFSLTQCSGSNFTLPTTSDNNISGTWSPTYDNQAGNTYTFTPNGGECAITASKQIVIEIAPTAPIANLSGNIVSVAAGLGNYQWQINGVDINDTNANSNTYTIPTGNIGTYTCVVSNSCGSATSNSINFNPTGINNITIENTIQFFPNPTNDLLNIKIMKNELTPKAWQIINPQGKTILTGTFNNDTQSINVNSLKAGVYVIKTKFTTGEIGTQKFIKI
jgi:alpha-tubulin suppressor-like RCC1 family protein